jgi:hypothetical protein
MVDGLEELEVKQGLQKRLRKELFRELKNRLPELEAHILMKTVRDSDTKTANTYCSKPTGASWLKTLHQF